jgi:predicted MPP superfamily phosphohydrolase
MMKRTPLQMFSSRYLPDALTLSIICLLQTVAAIAFLWSPARRSNYALRRTVVVGWLASLGVVALGFMFRFRRVAAFLPRGWSNWAHGLGILWAFFSVLMIAAWAVASLVPRPKASHSPSRRAFLQTANAVVLAVPAAVTGYGVFVLRYRLTLREQNITIPDLPPDLHGLRIAQVTDIHLSPFLSAREFERAVNLANETRPHLTVVTGDLITTFGDPLDECLSLLARLRADAGVFGCMGNHEIVAGTEAYTQERGARLGIRFLRHQFETLQFGTAHLNLVGVDYQRSSRRYLARTEKLVVPGAFNVLLSHNPDVFPEAVRKGFPLTLAGHTHGGQVRVEILGQDLNVARFFTPYVDGLYRIGPAAAFVSRGIGTIALPARLGAPPEVALLTLSSGSTQNAVLRNRGQIVVPRVSERTGRGGVLAEASKRCRSVPLFAFTEDPCPT